MEKPKNKPTYDSGSFVWKPTNLKLGTGKVLGSIHSPTFMKVVIFVEWPTGPITLETYETILPGPQEPVPTPKKILDHYEKTGFIDVPAHVVAPETLHGLIKEAISEAMGKLAEHKGAYFVKLKPKGPPPRCEGHPLSGIPGVVHIKDSCFTSFDESKRRFNLEHVVIIKEAFGQFLLWHVQEPCGFWLDKDCFIPYSLSDLEAIKKYFREKKTDNGV